MCLVGVASLRPAEFVSFRIGQATASSQADARTRTADPFITSEVLYQLSYVGEAGSV
jgi:hypothetical protein